MNADEEEEHDVPIGRTCIRYKGVIIFMAVIIVVVTILALSVSLIYTVKHPKPHVVMIVADDLGYNDIGYYNQHNDIRTPFLDSLSQEGIRLDRYYAFPVCTPSRAALFTGRYPFRYGMQGARTISHGTKLGLPTTENNLLPQVMKEAGYKTYMVGKWHLGFSKWAYLPVKRGFDYFYGIYGRGSDYFTHQSNRVGISDLKVFDLHEHTKNEDGTDKIPTNADKANLINKTLNVYSELLFTRKAVNIIEEHDEKDPMFLTVCHKNPHGPLQALDEDFARVPQHVDNEVRRNFSALMSSLDYGVEEIVDALKMKGIYEQTIIIFSSDNGGSIRGPAGRAGGSNYPYRGGKWTNWEGGVRVPAFIVGPGIPKNVSSNALFHITDWLPTLAKLVGVKPKKELDGVDQTDLLLHSGPSSRSDIIIDLDPMVHEAAIIKGDYKLFVGGTGYRTYDDIYEPLKGDDVQDSNTEEDLAQARVITALRYEYEKASLKPGYNISDMKNVGNFTPASVSLYNLKHDPSESHDLFTDVERFRDIAREMYDVLEEKAANQMVGLLLFLDTAHKYQDLTNSYEEIKLYDGTSMKKWYPWLDDNKSS